ncbi:MAG: RNA polymerase sigma factor [Arenicella sp.]
MTESDWTDQIDQLLYRVQRQDQPALKALYMATSSKLLGLITRIIKDKAEAEDVLQEVFLKVWEQSHKFTGSGSAWGWLCVLTRNKALDRVRSLANRRHNSIDDYQDLLGSMVANDTNPHSHSIQHCLNSLKEQSRNSIVLSFIYGYSHTELVDELSAPLGTIKSWVRRGLQELKQCLA